MKRPEPAETYRGLLVQFNALAQLAIAQEKMIGVLNKELSELREKDRSLSEEAINALRDENAYLSDMLVKADNATK